MSFRLVDMIGTLDSRLYGRRNCNINWFLRCLADSVVIRFRLTTFTVDCLSGANATWNLLGVLCYSGTTASILAEIASAPLSCRKQCYNSIVKLKNLLDQLTIAKPRIFILAAIAILDSIADLAIWHAN